MADPPARSELPGPKTSFVFTSSRSLFSPGAGTFSQQPRLSRHQLQNHRKDAHSHNIGLDSLLHGTTHQPPSPSLLAPTPSYPISPASLFAPSVAPLGPQQANATLSLSEVLQSPANSGENLDRGRHWASRHDRSKRTASYDNPQARRRRRRARDSRSVSKPRGRLPETTAGLKRDSSFLYEEYDATMTLYWVAQKLESYDYQLKAQSTRSTSSDAGLESSDSSLSRPLSTSRNKTAPVVVANRGLVS